MPTARYRFTRNTSVNGFLSRNRASTDAHGALNDWSNDASGRAYTVIGDNDDTLLVDLTWGEGDLAAAADLDTACRRLGLDRSHVPR